MVGHIIFCLYVYTFLKLFSSTRTVRIKHVNEHPVYKHYVIKQLLMSFKDISLSNPRNIVGEEEF